MMMMMKKKAANNKAYWYGWRDGRYGERCCFTENERLAELEVPAERLHYYRGHRAGYETRLQDGHLREAS
jgi:hypothetical protein